MEAAAPGTAGNWNEVGAYALPGSRAGVNPVFHPRWFGRRARANRAYAFAPFATHKHGLRR